jgi:hypothetical protein
VHLNRAVTARWNLGLAFICNKTYMPGGHLAEGHRQRGAKDCHYCQKLVSAEIEKLILTADLRGPTLDQGPA